jgi:four helix bundle protein
MRWREITACSALLRMGDHRNLEVWKLACALSDRVDAMIRTLPRRVQLTLGDQASRSGDSIHLQIAEGCGLNSDPQLIKFVRGALGSMNELDSALDRLLKRNYLRPEFHDLVDDAGVLRRKLGAFLKKLVSDQRH